MSAPSYRAELAELAVLTEYDRVRQRRGHDFGCGQRGAELMRRRRALREKYGLDVYSALATVTLAELAQAWARVGAPRLRRAAGEDFRRETPSTRRTLEVWRTMARAYGAELGARAVHP